MSVDYDVVIVGGGMAGLSAGLTSARLGRSTMIVTGGVPGGQLVSIEKIEGAPGFPEGAPGYDLCPATQEQADAAGAAFSMARCEGLRKDGDLWSLATSEGEIVARGIIVATGTDLAKLGVPGEEGLFGKGVSHCASCDAPLLRGKTALVVGGGDSAMQEALTLAAHVAKVVIVARGDDFAGQAAYRDGVRAERKIEARFGAVVEEILGANAVIGVRVRDLASHAQSEIAADAVFAYVGLTPNAAFVGDLVALDATGRIPVDAAMRTQARGLCAAGNVRAGSPHRAAGAMGDGATAATALDRYLSTGEWRTA